MQLNSNFKENYIGKKHYLSKSQPRSLLRSVPDTRCGVVHMAL